MSEAQARLDEAARAEASEPSVSILLEAPAGSGKTAVLTRRYLRLLCTVEDPGEVLAITFTRKAAAEMRSRVVRALRGAIPMDDPEAEPLRALAEAALAHGAARGWRIDSEPQSLRIQTIDSFNYWLASQLPVASRAGAQLTVTETAGELYQRAARRALLAADAEPELASDAQRLFERLDNHWLSLERLIAQMLSERGHWLHFVVREDPQRLCRRVDESLAALTRLRLESLCALFPEPERRRAETLPGCRALGSEPGDLGHWQRFAHLVLTRHDWRRQLSARHDAAFSDPALRERVRGLIAELTPLPGLREALLELAHAPGAQLTEDEGATLRALSRVLARAAAELHTEFAQAGRVDYTYVTGAARAALTEAGEPTELALAAGLALRHILVDEFQDTSLAQVQLLESLTVGWEEGDGRTLFVVGDPMQSIYRFRDAEVGLFLRARAAGIGRLKLRVLRLAHNFRATRQLIEFVNDTFTRVFPRADEPQTGGVSYRPSVAAPRSAPAPEDVPPVSLQLFADDRRAEAGAIAAHVARLRRLEPQSTIAVLVVAHAHAVPVIAALEAAALPALGVDLVPLRERLVVRDLVQLARALYDLADRSAWLAVLRAPWCGARLRTLTALSSREDEQVILEALTRPDRLARCDPSDLPRLARLRAVLESALAAQPGATVTDWLETTWLRLGAADAYSGPELEDARTFFAALAARAAASEWITPADFPTLLEHLYGAPAAGDRPVQVMTIHRAKGLEFDHVIVPALDRPTRTGERRLLRWIDVPSAASESHLLIAPIAPVGAAGEGALNLYVRDLIRQHERHERCRLMYVAATRARRTLWLSAAPAPSADGTVKPDRRSFLATLWPALAGQFETVPGAGAPLASSPRAASLIRLAATWQPPDPPSSVLLRRLPAAWLETTPPEFSWVRETQRDIGTVVHAWLARLSGQPLPPAAPEAERALLLAELQRLGVAEREQPRALEEALAAVRRTLADARGRWILSGEHRDAHSEWELSGVSGGRLRSLKIDRSFVDETGTRWVIDYKTSRHEGADLEGFLARELERYRPQLEGYRALAAQLGPEPVRAALYFPLLGAFRELA
ncbi:MAG TPA: UvrD-helicase domain-containing protein [Steroidobacteraceae bacterium]|nr:UvrD-helicase domain-containing protein [Steroidobacteraceae bacterium]